MIMTSLPPTTIGASEQTLLKRRVKSKQPNHSTDEAGEKVTENPTKNGSRMTFPLITRTNTKNGTMHDRQNVAVAIREKTRDSKARPTGVSVSSILTYDHNKQESALTCLGLSDVNFLQSQVKQDSIVDSATPQDQRLDKKSPVSKAAPDENALAGSWANYDHVTDSTDTDDSRDARSVDKKNDSRAIIATSEASQEVPPAETKNSRSAVKRFRAFVATETSKRNPLASREDDESSFSPSKTLIVSTKSDITNQLSSKRSLFSQGTAMEQLFHSRDLQDTDDASGQMISHKEDQVTSETMYPESKESSLGDKDKYYTPYRHKINRSSRSRHLARKKRKSPTKVDIRKLNKMKSRLNDACSKVTGGAVSLPSVAETQGTATDQCELESVTSISPSKYTNYLASSQRKKVSKSKGTPSYDEASDADDKKVAFLPKTSWAYTDHMDTTLPISFNHGYKNAVLKKVDYGRFQGGLSNLESQAFGDARQAHNKSAILHKLKGLFKNKGSLRGSDSCPYQGVDDISDVQLSSMQHSVNEASRMRGGKVQRGTFLTRHSKWVNKFQSLQEEDPSHDVNGEGLMTWSANRLADSQSRQYCHSTHALSRGSPEPPVQATQELTISRTGRCSSRGVYQLTLGDRSVLIIDHDRNRASREAQIRPQITGALYKQQDATDDLGPNARMWVPPNTPQYEVIFRSSAHTSSADENFLPDEMQRSNEDLIGGDIAATHAPLL